MDWGLNLGMTPEGNIYTSTNTLAWEMWTIRNSVN